MASLPVVKLNDYIVCDKIGSGGYADVYKAYRKPPAHKEYVAIKAVLRSNLSPGATDNLITEIRLLKKLKHDHIVQLKDFLCDENYVYIIMEYCGGGDLSHFIKSRNRLPETACQRFLQQIAAALKYMRNENVSHFDLKPQNILLASRKNPVIKIADFGLAQHMTEADHVSKIKGSPLYMAPEILLDKKYDAKVDLWSVGVILYECLFGRAPYSSASLEELVQRIKTDTAIRVPPNTSISPKCHDLLMRCLERDHLKRIEFEEFFNHPFVDLEHKPGPDSCDKARVILQEAVQLDEKQEYEEALKLYVESLLFLVPAIHYERDVSRKQALRKSVKQYLERTEKLKELLSDKGLATSIDLPSLPPSFEPDQTPLVIRTQTSCSHHDKIDELMGLASTTATMAGAIDVGKSAELYEREGSYSVALEKYELALGRLLNLLQNEPAGKRRELLLYVSKHWMDRAESVKAHIPSDNKETVDAKASGDPAKKKNILQRKITKLTERKETTTKTVTTISVSSGKVLTEADYEKNCAIQ